MRNNQPVTGREYQFPHGKTVISYTNLKGQITRANDAFIDLSGFTQAELMGQPHNLVRHPDMPTEAFRDMWDTLKKWGIQLSAVPSFSMGAKAQKYPEKLALYGEAWLTPRTHAPQLLAWD
ncbi:MAG: PAS domain-containing protein [Ferrovum myxofaciens]|nr:PAS domain-containing protein [Ferrovum myxofaciens]QWY74912.1 MAG: PAS domain-containing protein [Ferrovum myxofaciens]